MCDDDRNRYLRGRGEGGNMTHVFDKGYGKKGKPEKC
jgi:hypothetical protein